MAVFCEVPVPQGTREQAVKLEQQVQLRLEAAGGPPEGLLFLCVHPEGEGFRIVMAFRSVDTAHAEVEGMRADAAAVGMGIGDPAMAPVWSMALPGAR